MTAIRYRLLFIDANVLVEAVFLPDSHAAAVIRLAADRTVEIITCKSVITDVENAILKKLSKTPERLDKVMQRWAAILTEAQITISSDPPDQVIKETYDLYMAAMRHKPDIQVLAAALLARPDAILSGNREHFNDLVAKKCGLRILSCMEFAEILAAANV